MAVTKWYFTTTAADTNLAADNEVALSTTAPGSGSLSASIAASTKENAFLGSTDAAPHDSNDWTALVAADCQVVIDITANGANLTLKEIVHHRFSSGLVSQASDDGGTGGWDSNTGTGVKTYTPTTVVALGTAGATDRLGAVINSENADMMTAETVTIALGTSS